MLWQDTANKYVMARHSQQVCCGKSEPQDTAQQVCCGKTQPTSMPQWMNQTGVSQSHSRQECDVSAALYYVKKRIRIRAAMNELQYCTPEAVTLVPRSGLKSNANHIPKIESKWCWWQAGWDGTEARPCTRMGRERVWAGSSTLVLASATRRRRARGSMTVPHLVGECTSARC
jgi:hypothetical protein